MGPGVRQYEKDAPVSNDDINLSQFNFKMVKVEKVPNKSGWLSYKFSIPQSVRASHSSDVVYGPEWRQLMSDFDSKLLRSSLQE